MILPIYLFIYFLSAVPNYYFQSVYVNPNAVCTPTCTGTFVSPYILIKDAFTLGIGSLSFNPSILYLKSGIYKGINNLEIIIPSGLSITILGEGQDLTIIDCENNFFGFYIMGGGSYEFKLMTIKNCIRSTSGADNGGAIYAKGLGLKLTQVSFLKNIAFGNGGALYFKSGTLTINNCIFNDNLSHKNGGGMYVTLTYAIVKSYTEIISNSAYLDGGGLYVYSAYLELNDHVKINSNNIHQPTVTSMEIGCILAEIPFLKYSEINPVFSCGMTCDIHRKCDALETPCSPYCYCPHMYYKSFADGCDDCHITCKTCFGSTQSSCLTCYDHAHLTSSSSECVCDTHYYCSTPPCSHLCLLCDANCLSCDGPSFSDCTSCISNKVLINKICEPCHFSCLTCMDTTNKGCLSCNNQKFLVKIGNYNYGKCCSPRCQSCDGPNENNCLSCINNYYLYIGYCVEKCPSNFYSSSFSKKCEICDSSCLTCSEGGTMNCLTCKTDFYLDLGTCVQNCPLNKYISKENVCEMCHSECSSCKDKTEKSCLMCSNSLKVLNEGECIDKCPLNKFIDQNNCVSCSNDCSICQSINKCEICLDGFYNNKQKKCVLQQNISYTVEEIKKNFEYEIKFSNIWEDFFNNIKNYSIVEIKTLELDQFQYYFEKTNASSFILFIEYFLKQIPENVNLSIVFATHSDNSEFKIEDNKYSFPIVEGDNSFYYDPKTNSYIQIKRVIPYLSYTEKLTKIKINFKDLNNFPPNFCFQLAKSIIFIKDFIFEKDFSYLINCEDIDLIYINFFYSPSLIDRRHLTVNFNFSYPYLIKNDFIIQPTYCEIDLYEITNNDYEIMEYFKIHSNSPNMIWPIKLIELISLLMINKQDSNYNSMRSLMLLELIILLKFIDLNYPQNLREFFMQSAVNEKKIFFNYKFEEKFEETNSIPILFRLYKITPYFLDYTGDQIIINIIFYMVGVIILLLKKLIKTKKVEKITITNPVFKMCWKNFIKFILFIEKGFVWDYYLFVFITNYQIIQLKSLIACKFANFKSEEAKLNTLLAYLVLSFSFLSLLFLSYMIKKELNINQVLPEYQMNNINELKKQSIDNNLIIGAKIDTGIPIQNSQTKEISKIQPFGEEESLLEKRNKALKKLTTLDKISQIKRNIQVKKLETFYPKTLEISDQKIISTPPENTAITELKLIDSEKNENIEENNDKITVKEIETPFPIVLQKSKDKTMCRPSLSLLQTDEPVNMSSERVISPNRSPKDKSYWNSNNQTIDKDNYNKKNYELNKNNLDTNLDPKINKIDLKNLYFKNQNYSILFTDYKLEKFLGRYFTIFDLIRQSSIAFITIIFHSNSTFQISMINLIQFSYIFAVVLKIKPFKTRILTINFIIGEILVCLAFLSCFIIEFGSFNVKKKENLGLIVPICNILLLYWIILMIIIRFILHLFSTKRKKSV